MMQIRMESTMARLGYHFQKPVQEIEQPPAELNMRQAHAQVRMERTHPRLHIDQTEAFADAGLKGVLRVNQERAAEGRQAVLEGIGRRVAEGLQLRAIETKTDQLKNIDKQKLFKPMLSTQMTFIPRYGSLQIEGIPGDLRFDVQQGGVEFDPVTRPHVHNYTPGKVEAYMDQVNSLRIWVEGNQVDMKL